MTFAQNNTPSQSHILMTGSTGLLGRYLMKDLLLAGIPVATLVRPARRQSAADRMEAIVQTWEEQLGRRLPRPHVLEGDLSDDQLGLDPEGIAWISENCHAVLHNA
ncbi:MAG: SDR family oxidoreductase, partial [Planctomycetes bacterium]|nr:SDR family oxidoreductase [Planctomycetota bacterium]